MKIFIIDPPQQVFKYFMGHIPSPAVVQLAAYMERRGHHVEVLDVTTFDRVWDDLEEKLRRGKPDIVGISNNSTNTVNNAFHTATLAKMVDPQVIVVAGGAHMTALSEESLRVNGDIDFIVRGEGEMTFAELAAALERRETDFSNIPGLAYLDGDRFVQTPRRELIEDINTLPIPAYHLLPMLNVPNPETRIMPYRFPTLGMKPYESIFVSTARGCYGTCRFCSETAFWNHTWRARNAKNMVDEMEVLCRDFGRTNFYFVDNAFNWRRNRIEEFIDELSARNLPGITFWYQTRVELLLRDLDLLPKLKKLGLYQISFGVESGSQDILDSYNKSQKVEMVTRAMKAAKEQDLVLLTNVMWGHEDDTPETLLDTYHHVKKYADIFAMQIFTPVPGTPYYERYRDRGMIKEENWDVWDMFTPVVETKTVPHDKMLRTVERIQSRFHLRPRIIYRSFFDPNPFIRSNYKVTREIVKRTVTNTLHEVQTNYRPFEEYMAEQGYRVEKTRQGTCIVVDRDDKRMRDAG
ncbi:MAG: cobalamin-dependent protein [Deltaproteobacteria bacterium]|nr:cobalamin-dependent protein [Candidatus Zymogenaceae bacterium]